MARFLLATAGLFGGFGPAYANSQQRFYIYERAHVFVAEPDNRIPRTLQKLFLGGVPTTPNSIIIDRGNDNTQLNLPHDMLQYGIAVAVNNLISINETAY